MLTPAETGFYFDWGGVVRSLHDNEMFDDLARELGKTRDTIDAAWKEVGPMLTTGKGDIDQFYQRLGVDLTPGTAGWQDLEFLFLRAYVKISKLNAPVVGIINKLQGAGYTTGLLSNTIPPHVRFFKGNPEFSQYDLFDPKIVSPQVGCKKGDPDHKIYVVAEERLGKQTIFFVDDSKKYAEDIPNELNKREGTRIKWVGIWTPDFDRVAQTIEERLKVEGVLI